MGNQTINIEKVESGATVNIYDADSNENKEDKKKASITIPAIDKYSSPLEIYVEQTPWGEKFHRVSFILKNALIDQAMQHNYLTYKTAERAEEAFNKIVDKMEKLRKDAIEKLVHSVFTNHKIWKFMSLMEKYDDRDASCPIVVSKDLEIRGADLETVNDSAKPVGLVFHDVEHHWPHHNGIFQMASKKEDMLDIVEKIEKRWLENDPNKDIVKSFCRIAKFFPFEESESDINLKKEALIKIRPIIKATIANKSDQWISNWILTNKNRIVNAINNLKYIAVKKYAEENGDISANDYDLFIFDADKTIWNGIAAKDTEPPYKVIDKETVVDANGNEIKLKDGVRDTLMHLRLMGKDLGLISKSEKHGVDYQDQPVIQILKSLGILHFFNEMVVIDMFLPKSMFVPRGRRTIFIDDDKKNLVDVEKHSDADAVDAADVIFMPEVPDDMKKTESHNWYRFVSAKKGVPKKPGKDYELDHKKPKWKGGTDDPKNLHWIKKDRHKKKTQNEGSFEYGGKLHQDQEKKKGKKHYHKYQQDAGKAKVQKERDSMSEEEFSALQRKRVNKRWNKKSNSKNWYRNSSEKYKTDI